MKPDRTHRLLAASGLLATLLVAISGDIAGAEERASAPPRRPKARAATTAPALPAAPAAAPAAALAPISAPGRDALFFDAPGDGSLWALGESYKIGFEAEGATFYPVYGPSAPKHYPHRLSPAAATLAGRPLDFEREVLPAREGWRVELDRGAFVEAYDLTPNALEQTFVFPALPRRGELVLRLAVGSEFEGLTSAAGITFRGALGEVRYGRATAIDAAGRRQEAPTELVDGSIVIRVPAEFVAAARLPLVIDPVVANVPINTTTDDSHSPDVAWDPFDEVWIAVYERRVSATDSDVLARILNAAGTVLSEDGVDLSGVMWKRPRTANLAVARQFLVVAEVTNGTSKLVRGRTVEHVAPTILSLGPQFTISDGSAGNKLLPDVGGDPFQSLPSFYCVAYQQDFSTSDKRIAVRLVRPDSTLVGSAPTYLSPAAVVDLEPSVSNSNQADEWLISWTRDDQFSFGDIWAAYVNWDGAVSAAAFPVNTSTQFEGLSCASTRLATSNLTAIAFQRLNFVGLTTDVLVALLSGTTVVQTVNISTLENSGFGTRKQLQPSIDSNGAHFLVGYSELDPVFMHENVFVTDLFVSGNELGALQPHVTLQMWGLPQLHSRIAAQHSTSSSTNRFLVLYDVTQSSTNHDVAGQLFDVFEGGAWTTICPGDGSGLACPCGNSGGSGRGCANSANASGAQLVLNGRPSTIDDSAVLAGSGLPNNASCLFFQGTGASSGILFGDGIRCVNGTIVRLAVKVATGGSASFPQAGDLPLHVKGQIGVDGGTHTYQLWYRDTASFCTPGNFNLSNGVRVQWAR